MNRQNSLVGLYRINHNDFGPVNPDECDREIAEKYLRAYDKSIRPRVGDFVIMPDGSYERFSYDWGDGLQTSTGGSFALCEGYASFSGGLNPMVPDEKIHITDEIKTGEFWFFHHDYWTAHNGVGVSVSCRVYKVI